MRLLTTTFALTLTTLTLGLAGCAEQPTTTEVETAPPPATVDTHEGHDHGHAHPSEGPHHGDLIELGNDEYHAELVHTDADVTIYILDGAATKTVAIKAESVTINHTHDGTPEQFSLNASPDENDGEGMSSRFVSDDAELLTHIDEEHAEFRVAVTIKGQSYNGRFEHSHEGDHDHDHGHDHVH